MAGFTPQTPPKPPPPPKPKPGGFQLGGTTTGAKAPKPAPGPRFKDLGRDEQNWRLDFATKVGRMTPEQAAAARHFWGLDKPAPVVKAGRPGATSLAPYRAPKKPSFDTALKAARGDHSAQRELFQWERSQKAQAQGRQQTSAMRDKAIFGGSQKTVYKATKQISPLGKTLIDSLSPVEAARLAYGEAKHGRYGPAAISTLGIVPFGPGKGIKALEEISKGAKAVEGMTAAEKVLGATGKARALREQQAKLVAAEKGVRAAKAEEAMRAAGGGMEGHYAALRELKGKYPTLHFGELEHLSDTEMEGLAHQVQANPNLDIFEKGNLVTALKAAREGNGPRPFEIDLMKRAFGPQAAEEFARKGLFGRAKDLTGDVLNIPRTASTILDVSGLFRQGLVAGFAHPIIVARHVPGMFHAMGSQEFYDMAMRKIASSPTFKNKMRDGLAFTDLTSLTNREEKVGAKIAESIPGVGHAVKGSGRAYTYLLNSIRDEMYDHLIEVAGMRRGAHGVVSARRSRDIANWANVATGRGNLWKAAEPAAQFLNAGFFAPRLFASRFNVLNPVWYAKQDPWVAFQALKAMTKLILTGSTVLYLAKINGAEVGLDPYSADFGKMKFGNTRIDIWGGHTQFVRLVSQLYAGRIDSTTTGKTIHLGSGYGQLTQWDVLMRFFENKEAPVPAVIHDFFKHTDFAGQPFSWKREAYSHVIPFVIQDAKGVYHDTGSIPKAVGAYGLSGLGLGVQTYPAKAPALPSGSGGDTGFSGGFDTSGGGFDVPSGGFQLGGTSP